MNIAEFTRCSNCGACYNVCPKDAISVISKGLFYKPEVNPDSCVDCSMCVKICPVNNHIEGKTPLYALAGWHYDKHVVLSSSSGGVFYGIAQHVIDNGGAVFSAVYSDSCETVVFASSDEFPIEKMLKSKYVESNVGRSFRDIKCTLESGRMVLFCGTPCQVAGLSQYLGKAYDGLITCDFACGGLPSHQIYQEHLKSLEKRYRAEVKVVDFRPKTHGWKRHALKISFSDGKNYVRLGTEDEYMKSFLYGKYTVRDECLECKFSDCHLSDITIADFWLHEQISTLRNDKGISLILCNTEIGRRILNSIEEKYIFSEIDVDKASYNNKKTQISDYRRQKHNDFLALYREKGLALACRKFIPTSLTDRVKNYFVRILFRNGRI